MLMNAHMIHKMILIMMVFNGDVDQCPYDYENDADNDGICGDVDECPYDAENDADDDGICGNDDECPYDADNDIDGDDSVVM